MIGHAYASAPRVAVILPCYNEEAAIAKTVAAFRDALPGADRARAAYGTGPVVDGGELVVGADGPCVDIWVWRVR